MSAEEDDADLFPSTGGDDFDDSADGSDTSSKSDQETLREIEARKCAASRSASKKQSSTKVTKAMNQTKSNKLKTKKKKNSSGESVSACCRPAAFGSEELLLVSKAFMKVSNNAKHSTDKKAEKFWDEVCSTFEEFVASANKMNETNVYFCPIETGRDAESIRNCWKRRIQPAVQKFAGIIYNTPPSSGEVRDDARMDLYYGRIREAYSARSHTYPKDCPKSFQKLMKTYYFLSQHPKFEVEFPPDG